MTQAGKTDSARQQILDAVMRQIAASRGSSTRRDFEVSILAMDATLDAVKEAIREKLTVATTPLLNDAVVDFMFAALREVRGEGEQ